MDFNPDLTKPERTASTPVKINTGEIVLPETSLTSKESITINNLLSMTLSHIEDDQKCRKEIEVATKLINDFLHTMGAKELIEYLKVKIREREFHVNSVFKAYTFVQQTELSKEILMGNNRQERIIEASDRTRINSLLGMLNLNKSTD